jgi:hypothetical protein
MTGSLLSELGENKQLLKHLTDSLSSRALLLRALNGQMRRNKGGDAVHAEKHHTPKRKQDGAKFKLQSHRSPKTVRDYACIDAEATLCGPRKIAKVESKITRTHGSGLLSLS